VEIGNVAAIKAEPFDRYQTLDVMRAVCASKRDIPVYTGKNANIVFDLLTPYVFFVDGEMREIGMMGGLLGHWAVWTRRAVELLAVCKAAATMLLSSREPISHATAGRVEFQIGVTPHVKQNQRR
jgi:hypothetical protein